MATGTIALNARTSVTGDTPSTVNTYGKVSDYPAGYNRSNTVVIGGKLVVGGFSYWFPNPELFVATKDDGIYMYTTSASGTSKTVTIYITQI